MTVSELTQLLAAYPPDMRVVVNGYEEGYDDLEAHLVYVREIRLDAGNKWWEGRHREAEDTRTEGGAIVNSLGAAPPHEISMTAGWNRRTISHGRK